MKTVARIGKSANTTFDREHWFEEIFTFKFIFKLCWEKKYGGERCNIYASCDKYIIQKERGEAHATCGKQTDTTRPTSSSVWRRAQVQVAISVVSPPRRERHRPARSAKDGKRQDEQARQRGAVPAGRDQVQVVLEDARLVDAQVVLGVEADEDGAEDDARLRLLVGDETRVLDQLGGVDVLDLERADSWDKLEDVLACICR